MRTYADSCGIARALDLIGDRWALLVVRELLHGPKRFSDLRAGLGRVSAEVLGQRLRDLEGSGVVRREGAAYALTDRGRELAPVLRALGRWGSTAPLADGSGSLTPDALVVALETQYTGRLSGTYALRVDGDAFRFQDGRALRGEAFDPVAAIAGDAGTLAQVLWHGGDPAQLAISGDRRRAGAFLRAFPLPAG